MSTLSTILQSPAVRESRGLMAALVASGACIFGVVTMTSQVYLAYGHQQEIQQQSDEMRSTIQALTTQEEEINNQKYRPVTAAQVPSVQSDIMLSVQSHELHLDNVKVGSSSSSNNNENLPTPQTYDLQITGAYGNTIAFLQNFHARDALINILSIDMKPNEDGTIISNISYRIYVK